MDYVKIVTDGCPRPLVLAKTALKWIGGEKKVVATLKGADLVGLAYESVFPSLPTQQDVAHRVVPWDEVAADEGSGVVHIAPGCGAEDCELGRALGLPEICPVDESGCFYPNYDFLSGLGAAEAAPVVFEKLRALGKLYKTHEYTHMYPVCWRCKTQVLFRLVNEWYIKTDEIRPQLLREAAKVKWDPDYLGKRMADWLNNMGDWNISRKRFYGLPLPFYVCPDCGKVTWWARSRSFGIWAAATPWTPCRSCTALDRRDHHRLPRLRREGPPGERGRRRVAGRRHHPLLHPGLISPTGNTGKPSSRPVDHRDAGAGAPVVLFHPLHVRHPHRPRALRAGAGVYTPSSARTALTSRKPAT
jgi:hypothetical protein